MTILVTGASRGIGAGLVAAYQARGDDIIGTTRDGDWPLDVTDPASQAALATRLGGTPISLLVCNAGVYLEKAASGEDKYAPDLWARCFATNVTGVFLTVQAMLPHLRAAPNPRIAVISSQMASHTRAPGGSYIYRASKAAALNLGRNLATDLRADGVAVGIYHPGWVQTDMGGMAADLTIDDAVAGLLKRFDALSLETTGVFGDGAEMPF